MGYLPAAIAAVVGLLLLAVLIAVVLRHAGRTSRAATTWRGDVRAATSTLRLGVAAIRERRTRGR